MKKNKAKKIIFSIYFSTLTLMIALPSGIKADDAQAEQVQQQLQQQTNSTTNNGGNPVLNPNSNTNLNPNDFGRRPGDNKQPEQLNPGQEMQQQLEQQRKDNYKSLKQDEQEYYKNAAPKSSENPTYFMHSHPIKPSPLKSHLVQ